MDSGAISKIHALATLSKSILKQHSSLNGLFCYFDGVWKIRTFSFHSSPNISIKITPKLRIQNYIVYLQL